MKIIDAIMPINKNICCVSLILNILIYQFNVSKGN